MKRIKHSQRTGATTVEFALIVPLVFLFFFAAFEFSRMSMVRHTVEMAAYEGARRGIVPGATSTDAVDRANEVLAAIGTRAATITVTPNPITSQTSQITVDIQVPLDSNSWIPPFFLRGIQFDRAFTLGRENVSWGLTAQAPPPPPAQSSMPPPSGSNDNHNSGNGQNGNNNNAGGNNNNGNNGNGNNGNGNNGNNGNGNNGNGNNGNGNNGNGNNGNGNN
jgi:hypothetical protein